MRKVVPFPRLPRRPFGPDRRGSVPLMVTLMAPVLLGASALALEEGNWSGVHLLLQRRADLAAEAAMLRYAAGDSAETAAGAGADVAALNGAAAANRSWASATGTLAASDVTVAFVPGIRNDADSAATVTVIQRVPLTIGQLLSPLASVTIAATATAERLLSPGVDGSACLVATKPASSGFNGGFNVTAPGCSIVTNGDFNISNGAHIGAEGLFSSSLEVTGSAGVILSGEAATNTLTVSGGATLDAASGIYTGTALVDWGIVTNGTLTLYDDSTAITPPIYGGGFTRVADPLASQPDVAAAIGDLASPPASAATYGKFTGTWRPSTLNPGVYTGITSGSGSMTLNPGLYIVEGNISIGQGITLAGNGVTIVTSGTIAFGGGASVTLTPPTVEQAASTGGVAGLTLAGTSAGTQALSNGATPNLAGIAYFPNGTINLAGGVSMLNNCLEMVAGDYQLGNGASYGFSSACSQYTPLVIPATAPTVTIALVQ